MVPDVALITEYILNYLYFYTSTWELFLTTLHHSHITLCVFHYIISQNEMAKKKNSHIAPQSNYSGTQ